MKIIRYQSGGGVDYLPWVGGASASPTTPTSDASSNKDNLISEEIAGLIDQNGLNSDHQYFMTQLKSIYTGTDDLYSQFFGESKSAQFAKIAKAHSLANAMAINKSLYDSALSRISSTNAGNDVAISTGGRLYVMDKNGGIKTISPESYYKNSKQYQPLTNIELLTYRNENPNAAFNTSILPDLQNIISISSIVDDLLDTISKFDKIEGETKSQMNAVKRDGIKNGFEAILRDGPEGVYKITQHVKSSHEGYSNEKEYMEAITYLWNTLDQSQKKTIIAHTAAEGKDPTKMANVYSILAMALTKHTAHSTTNETLVDYDETASKNAGLGEVAKAEQMVKLTYLEQVANGRTTADQLIDLRSNTGISNITFIGNPYPVLDFSDNPVGTQSIASMLTKAQVGQIVDQSSISFGNQIIGTSSLDKILYDSNSPMYRVHLPYDVDFYNATGKYKPDLDAQEKFDNFIKWMKNENPSQPMITQKIQELGLNLNVVEDRNGQKHYVFKNSKEFIMMTGATSHRAVDISDKWKGKLSNADASYFYDLLESSTSYEEDMWRHFWGDAKSTYKSAIFMPILDSALATVATSGEYVPRSAQTDIQNRVAYNNTRIPTNF